MSAARTAEARSPGGVSAIPGPCRQWKSKGFLEEGILHLAPPSQCTTDSIREQHECRIQSMGCAHKGIGSSHRRAEKHLQVIADPFRAVRPGGGGAAARGGAVSTLREQGSRREASKKNPSGGRGATAGGRGATAGGRGATAGGRGATAGGVVCTVEMMRNKPDEEEYWHSSKFKAFTFEDEDDELSRLKESKQAVNSIRQLVEEDDDDDDDTEKVSWSGEPVGSISWSIKEMAGSNQKIDREPAFPRIPTEPSTLNKSHSGLSLSALFRGKAKSENSQSFSDAFSDSVRIYAPELRKPKSEYKDYVCDWSPEETVQRLLQGKAVSLEKFRSLQDKLLLLDFAVAAHDGNVITAVLIYLKRSLRKEVLFRELQSRQTALRHFIHYLTESREQKLLLELLRALGRTEDMALLQYNEHLSITDENNKRDFLKSCLSLPFSAEDSAHVQDHYTLLERQIIVEAADRQAERGGKVEIFQKFPRRASILNMPLITTLYYCCFYHYGEPEGTFSSPLNVRRTFKISEKQYFVTALAARAKLKAWSDVDALFTGRNWLGFTRKKSPLSFHRVVDVLQRNSAPTQVLQDYVALIDDAELRISLAQKLKCHDIVISTFRDMKDRQMLVAYRGKVEPGSAPERKIDDLLNNQQIRWKN